MITAAKIIVQLRSALDASELNSGTEFYTFDQDFKPAIDYACRKLIMWASTKQGSIKFTAELLAELRKIWVFQTSKYSRVEIPKEVATVTAVYPEVETYPTDPDLEKPTIYTYTYESADAIVGTNISLSVVINGTTIPLPGQLNIANAANIVTALNGSGLFSDTFTSPGLDLISVKANNGDVYGILSYDLNKSTYLNVASELGLGDVAITLDNGTTLSGTATAPTVIANLVTALNALSGLSPSDTFVTSGSNVYIISVSGDVYGVMTLDAGRLDVYEPQYSTGTRSPIVTSEVKLLDWVSILRDDVIFLDAINDAQRGTDQERARRRNNPYEPGYEAETTKIVSYSFWEVADFNSQAYTPKPNRFLHEIQIDPNLNQKIVAIALVKRYEDITTDADTVPISDQFENFVVELCLCFIAKKQGDQTSVNGLSEKEIFLMAVNFGMA